MSKQEKLLEDFARLWLWRGRCNNVIGETIDECWKRHEGSEIRAISIQEAKAYLFFLRDQGLVFNNRPVYDGDTPLILPLI